MIKVGYQTTDNEEVFFRDCANAPEANESIVELKQICSGRTDIAYFWISEFNAFTQSYEQNGFIDP